MTAESWSLADLGSHALKTYEFFSSLRILGSSAARNSFFCILSESGFICGQNFFFCFLSKSAFIWVHLWPRNSFFCFLSKSAFICVHPRPEILSFVFFPNLGSSAAQKFFLLFSFTRLPQDAAVLPTRRPPRKRVGLGLR